MKFFRNSRRSKSSALFMLLVFLLSTFSPTISFAISTGPGQPELGGFKPISVDNMVSLSTGDFSYNLPLLTVPGPGGGYPINMSYAAQPGMEQLASWVGLGWSLNPGAINREVRGLPDDFAGQDIVKRLTIKPNQTISFKVSVKNIEGFGIDLSKIRSLIQSIGGSEAEGNLMLSYNNHNGVSFRPGIGFSNNEAIQMIGANTAQPEGDNSGKSFTQKILESLQQLEYNDFISAPIVDLVKANDEQARLGAINRLSFANPIKPFNIPFDHPRASASFGLDSKGGFTFFGITGDLRFKAHYSRQQIIDTKLGVPAFGYNYNHLNYSGDKGMSDFSRENQGILSSDIKTISIPNFTHDVYSVSGQGMSGMVRPYRGEVSRLREPTSFSVSGDFGGGIEFNAGGTGETKLGFNPKISASSSFSGSWAWGKSAIRSYYDYAAEFEEKKHGSSYVTYKFANELTANANNNTVHDDYSLGRFDLETGFNVICSQPKLINKLTNRKVTSLEYSKGFRNKPEYRAKDMLLLTERESYYYTPFSRQVYNISTGSWVNVVKNTNDSEPKSKLSGEAHVTSENGTRYIYGIAAKNHIEKQSTFSVEPNHSLVSLNSIPKRIDYSSKDNSLDNDRGRDELYQSTETPEHAHAFLLTEVLSEDYTDLTSNGTSPDDLGTYVAFDYAVVKNFKTKMPLEGASYLPGNLSDKEDDKGSITYYDKDMYYLKSVKTKTHIAVFTLDESNPRLDNVDVVDENDNVGNGNKDLYRLKKIDLYNLNEYELNAGTAVPIKTVHFEMDYSLCKINGGTGKLTLKKVWFSSNGELTAKSLSPYKFSYGESGSRYNPNYAPKHVDRWGVYQDDADNPFGPNLFYPYTQQIDRELADSSAAAWSLKEITLPTGGKIQISYEADDYSWVQDKKAMKMYEIEGFASSAASANSPTQDLDANKRWMVVKLPDSIAVNEDVTKYFEGIRDTYYRVFTKLKNKPINDDAIPPSNTPFQNNGDVWDFVDGYMEIDPSTAIVCSSTSGYSNRLAVKVELSNSVHPVKLGAWMGLKNSRNYLVNNFGFNLDAIRNLSGDVAGEVASILSELLDVAFADPFFAKAEALGWGDEMGGANLPTSIVRLNAANSKLGGGHRVSQLKISDEWAAMGGDQTFTYGKKYIYNNSNTGDSYGVAQYEPSTGGEENPFRLPERYSSESAASMFGVKNDYLTQEMPYGEGFYPGAQIVYSQVRVENIANETVTTSGTGIEIHEFYTAKDYPVITEKTEVKKVNQKWKDKILNFLGAKSFFHPGYSQGFKIELNNMHGKSKRYATYPAGTDILNVAPTVEKRYIYRTKGGFSNKRANRLDNDVLVSFGDGFTNIETVGVNQDTYFDLKESSSQAVAVDVNANVQNITIPPVVIPIPTAIPDIDITYLSTRWVSLTKVINRTGILEKVISAKEGAEITEEYLAFDAETGVPTIASQSTAFSDKTYSYSQLAKWFYDDLSGKYQNSGLSFKGDKYQYYKPFLHEGDVLMQQNNGLKLTVVSTVGGNFELRKNDGKLASIDVKEWYRIVESGFANRLSESSGSMLFLNEPIENLENQFSGFKAYNAIPSYNRKDGTSFVLNDCDGLAKVSMRLDSVRKIANGNLIADLPATDSILFVVLNYTAINGNYVNCSNHNLEAAFPYNGPASEGIKFNLHLVGPNEVLAVHPNGDRISGVLGGAFIGGNSEINLENCFDFCLSGVLDAQMVQYTDTLRTFEDFDGDTSGLGNNPYRFNNRGVYSVSSSYFFKSPRTQTNINGYHFITNQKTDGEYDYFVPYRGGEVSAGWKYASSVVKIDQNGMVVQENNALDIPSAALYGHNRTIPIATVSNALYKEIAFDGFEEYGSTYDNTKKDNHISFSSGLTINSAAHTGLYSVQLESASATSDMSDRLLGGQEYVAQVWCQTGSGGYMQYYDGSTYVNSEPLTSNIEGWQLLELRFTASSGSTSDIILKGIGGIFDDIRVQPLNSEMTCFVYDPRTLQLIAQLDANHFATFFNYNKDQVLVQIKKETTRGIKTIQSTQQSLSQASN